MRRGSAKRQMVNLEATETPMIIMDLHGEILRGKQIYFMIDFWVVRIVELDVFNLATLSTWCKNATFSSYFKSNIYRNFTSFPILKVSAYAAMKSVRLSFDKANHIQIYIETV